MYYEFQGYIPNSEIDSYLHIQVISELPVTVKVNRSVPYKVQYNLGKNKKTAKLPVRDTYWSYLEKLAGGR